MQRFIAFTLTAVLLISCTVKEDRSKAPSFLGLTVTEQYEDICQSGKAWCAAYDTDGSMFASDALDEMDRRDTTVWYTIMPRRTVAVVVSNRDLTSGSVTAEAGDEFVPLYATRKDVVCMEENVEKTVSKFDKQFCLLTVTLNEYSRSFAKDLRITVQAPYNGTFFPSMAPNRGQYYFTAGFDEKAVATVRIPRQKDPGLTVTLVSPGSFSAAFNLYEAMKQSHYDWTADNLKDYSLEMALNSVDGVLEIADWRVVELGPHEF